MSQTIKEVSQLSFEQFHKEVLPAGKPLVIRGLVKDWPIVKAGIAGPVEFCNYVKKFDLGKEVSTVFGPPSIKGRIFYNSDMSGLNCKMGFAKLASSLDYLLNHINDEQPPTLALQSVVVSSNLSGMELENINPLLTAKIQPRIWFGSRTTVAAHYDPSENIACCLAGRRQFTLFPTEQIKNLYVGPLELTPAGPAISLVDFDSPDYSRFPLYREAEKAAMSSVLEPGDAIYIPYLWWHHVRALDNFNALMNYWWSDNVAGACGPQEAFFHALLAYKHMPEQQKQNWKKVLDHYVFEINGSTCDHIPEVSRGILGDPSDDEKRNLRNSIIKSLSRSN